MKNPIFEHLYDNWKAVHALPSGKQKDEEMRVVKMLCRGNLHWFVRRLVGGVPGVDDPEWCEKKIAEGEMLAPSEFTRRRRVDEARQRKNK